MEQTIHDSFLPTSTPAQSGHPSLITFNNPATMLYHLLTQNLPSNPLSSTQALSAAKENTKSLLEKPFSSGTPRHRKYAYPLPGWPLFPVPHSWYFKPSLLASYPFQGHTWPPFSPYPFCLLWHGGVKGAE